MIMTQMLPILFAAALKLAAPFTDHAILQRDKPVVIRGSADAGAEVSVSFAGNTVRGVADAEIGGAKAEIKTKVARCAFVQIPLKAEPWAGKLKS